MKELGSYAADQHIRKSILRGVNRYADKRGMSLTELNAKLFALSVGGDLIFGSRYKGQDMGPDENGLRFEFIDGVASRNGFGYSGTLGYNVIGISADIVDIILGYQGLPTSSSVGYMLFGDKEVPLVGYSLGALDVNNAARLGFASDNVYAISLPLMNRGIDSVKVTIGGKDLINGRKELGLFFTPSATLEANITTTGIESSHTSRGYKALKRWNLFVR